jgi:hypothetical protein
MVIQVLQISVIIMSIGYVLFSFFRERSRIKNHRRMLNYMTEGVHLLHRMIMDRENERHEKVNWKEEGF